MFEFQPNNSGTTVKVFYGGIYLGRIICPNLNEKNVAKRKKVWRIIDTDMLNVVRGSALYKAIRIDGFPTQDEAARFMKDYRRPASIVTTVKH